MRTRPGMAPILAVALACVTACAPSAAGPTPGVTATATAMPTVTATATMPPSPTLQASPSRTALRFHAGRNDYQLVVDGAQREFIAYVPPGYQASRPTPLVMMFHGHGQDGDHFYDESGWKEKAEQEGFLVFFPTALRYTVLDDGEPSKGTRWSTDTLALIVQPPGTEIKDDTHFVQAMLDAAGATWTINPGRVFAAGFSNGAGFVNSQLMVKMPNVFAAYATAEGGMATASAAREPIEPTVSRYSVIGSRDRKLLENLDRTTPFPMEAEEVLADPLLGPGIDALLTRLQLAKSYEVRYERPDFSTLTFDDSLVGADNELVVLMVAGMGHIWPDGEASANGLVLVDRLWPFFLEHARA